MLKSVKNPVKFSTTISAVKAKKNKKKSHGKKKKSHDNKDVIGSVKVNSRRIPLAVSRSMQFTRRNNKTTIIHSEFIEEIVGSALFDNQPIMISPTNVGMFSWLSGIAKNYEFYTIKKLIFKYTPTCPTTTPGNLTFNIDYDTLDAVPVSKQEMMNSYKTLKGNPYSTHVYVADLSRIPLKRKYVAQTQTPTTGPFDPFRYYGGIFNIASDSGTDNAQWGTLSVEYAISFDTPVSHGESIANETLFFGPRDQATDKLFNSITTVKDVTSGVSHDVYMPQSSLVNVFKVLTEGYYTVDFKIPTSAYTSSRPFDVFNSKVEDVTSSRILTTGGGLVNNLLNIVSTAFLEGGDSIFFNITTLAASASPNLMAILSFVLNSRRKKYMLSDLHPEFDFKSNDEEIVESKTANKRK